MSLSGLLPWLFRINLKSFKIKTLFTQHQCKNLKIDNDIPGSWYGFTKMLVSWMQSSGKCLQGPACVFLILFYTQNFIFSFEAQIFTAVSFLLKVFLPKFTYFKSAHNTICIRALLLYRVQNKRRDTFINFWKKWGKKTTAMPWLM